MKGIVFSKYFNQQPNQDKFSQLLGLLQELLLYTNGDIKEALAWMTELDKEHRLTDDSYGMGDFVSDLEDKGYLNDSAQGRQMTSKMSQAIRKKALEHVFGKIKKGGSGQHQIDHTGRGEERLPDMRSFQFGDKVEQLALTESLTNAYSKYGIDWDQLHSDDLLVHETHHLSQTSTVLMIDVSHSMILYGEDRITPAKRVAMALAEFMKTRYPKDTLDIIAFGNDAWQIELKDIPYLQVGPFHTNTVAGLQLAQDLLRKRKNPNKQIFMITDGKPSCLKEGAGYYKNSFGLDRKIVNKTLNEAAKCKRNDIDITTFMIASDPYLKEFIEEFTQTNKGKAFYSSLDELGSFVLYDYAKNRRKNV